MGISAAAFVLLIASTGLLLNHTDTFGFDKNHVRSDWVLDWYGIEAPKHLRSFLAGDHYITLMGEDLYLNQKEIKGNYRQLAGAIFLNDMFVIAVSDSILLLASDGEQIDYLHSKDGAPAGIRQIGIDSTGSIVVRTDYEHYQPDANFLHWQRRDNDAPTIRWASSSPISAKFKATLQHHFRGEVLPVERVLLDMHSGRFFGRFGTLLFDIAALLLMFLALSGTWIWLKRKQ